MVVTTLKQYEQKSRSVGISTLKPGTIFRDIDAAWCPEMVALPAGEFMMGSPEDEEAHVSCEGPQHRVTIGYHFAIGRYPITVGEYRRFVEATGHSHAGGLWIWDGSASTWSFTWRQEASKSWRDPGFQQTDRHPVVGVSWRDAQAYVESLQKETGKPYRLPTEAEWEYACRAGTTMRYSFGKTSWCCSRSLRQVLTNLAFCWMTSLKRRFLEVSYGITPKDANYRESKFGKTTEVGSYPPNVWGLYDMHGNVSEWVGDIWHDSYKGAPTDGTAWTDGEGKDHVTRGGSWVIYPRFLRSASRIGALPDKRIDFRGFRVARTLD